MEFSCLTQRREYSAYIDDVEGYYNFIAAQGGEEIYGDGVGWSAQNNDAAVTGDVIESQGMYNALARLEPAG